MNRSDAKAAWPVLMEDCYDYSIPVGWGEIVEDLCEALSICPDVRIVQAKNKLGSLRIYLEFPSDERTEKLISAAEYKCERTCEDCGDNGEDVKQRGGGWLHVRCEKCDEKSKS